MANIISTRAKHLTVDIETIPLPIELRGFTKPKEEDIKYGNLGEEKKKEKYKQVLESWSMGEGAALDAFQASIPLIGFKIDDTDYNYIISENDKEGIIKFWELISRFPYGSLIIGGFNVFWDLRMLARRSVLNKIQVPQFITSQLNSYNAPLIFDVMQYFQFNDRKYYFKLDTIAKAFGLSVKSIKDKNGNLIKGENFFKHWAIDKPACIEYNKEDINTTWELIKIMKGL
jgi:hypothetical protein